MTEHVLHSEDEIRRVCNEKTPHDAFVMALSFMQRQTVALESIADSLKEPPTVLFEEAKSSGQSEH